MQPGQAGAYFVKIQCFCFQEQTLQAGETMEFPVVFYIEPSIADEPNLKHLNIDHPVLYVFRLARTASPLRQRAPPSSGSRNL